MAPSSYTTMSANSATITGADRGVRVSHNRTLSHVWQNDPEFRGHHTQLFRVPSSADTIHNYFGVGPQHKAVAFVEVDSLDGGRSIWVWEWNRAF
jgi:hypothetical protein